MDIATITGSSGGAKPLQDGTTRGGIATVLLFIAQFIGRKTGWLNDSDIADFAVVVPFISLFLWAVWDRINR